MIRFNFHSPTFKRQTDEPIPIDPTHLQTHESGQKSFPGGLRIATSRFATSFSSWRRTSARVSNVPVFPAQKHLACQPTIERTTVVIIEVTRRVSRRSAPRTSPTSLFLSLSGWRRETMNNGTSRFAQLNASVRIRERWNSRRSPCSHKRERSGRSYLPSGIANHPESVELVIDAGRRMGEGEGRSREIQSDELDGLSDYCSILRSTSFSQYFSILVTLVVTTSCFCSG